MLKLNKKRKAILWITMILLFIFYLGLTIPQETIIPVRGAGHWSWNHTTFWHEPWGSSGVHKGVDIFADRGSAVLAATGGFVIYHGQFRLGGNVVFVLGPKWRLHYYAHLNDSYVSFFDFLEKGDVIGTVGNTGNARNRPPHLHYSILSLIPDPDRWDDSTQGWKKMFYLDPTAELLGR